MKQSCMKLAHYTWCCDYYSTGSFREEYKKLFLRRKKIIKRF